MKVKRILKKLGKLDALRTNKSQFHRKPPLYRENKFLYLKMLKRLHEAEKVMKKNGGVYPDTPEDDARMLEWIRRHNEIASPNCTVEE